MKKLLIFTLGVIAVLSFACGLVACEPAQTPHVHTWSQTLSKDNTHHWQQCLNCEEINGRKTPHDFSVPKSDQTHQWLECECGAIGEKTPLTPPENLGIYSAIKFSSESKDMVIGETLNMRASKDFTANFNIEYSSNNQSVVSIDQNGMATANAKGQAVITARYNETYATCKIMVTDGGLLPLLKTESISGDYSVIKGDKLVIEPYVLFNGKSFYDAEFVIDSVGENATTQVKTINNKNVLEITGVKQGLEQIVVKAKWNGFDKTATLIKTISVNVRSDYLVYINGGSSSSFAIYNKELKTQNGVTQTTTPLVVTTSAQAVSTSVVVEDENIASYDAQTNTLVGKGKIGQTNVMVSVTDASGNVHTKTLPLSCFPAVGDYIDQEGSFVELDINTLSGELNLSEIFGKEVTLTRALDGRNPLTVKDNKIVGGLQGDAFNEPQPIKLTLYGQDEGYNVMVKPYLYKDIQNFANDYQYSCETGEFFDQDFVLSNIASELGKEGLTSAYLQTDQGQRELMLENGVITDLSIGNTPEKFTLALVFEDVAITLSVTAYTLIIDQMQDFAYFTVYEGQWTYHRAFMWTIASDVMEWDGYYVLANDIDATTYNHKGLEAPYYHLSWDNVSIIPATFESGGAIYACVDDKDAYGLFGKGFMGTFDGRGHVIDGYKPNSGGLFQALNGGYIKDLGFTNTRLSPTTGILSGIAIKNTVIDNVFVHVDPNYSYGAGEHTSVLTSSVSRRVIFRNIVIINQTTNKSSNSSSILGGQDYCSAYGNNNSNVHIISPLPIFFKYSSFTNTITALYEAEYIDGQKTDFNADYQINQITTGVYRWNNMDTLKAHLSSVKEQSFAINDWIWNILNNYL